MLDHLNNKLVKFLVSTDSASNFGVVCLKSFLVTAESYVELFHWMIIRDQIPYNYFGW